MGRIAELVGSHAPCVLDAYSVEIRLEEGGRRAEIRLEMDYRVSDESKPDGFKFLGDGDVRNVRVTDGDGRPMRFQVRRHRETLVRYFFDPPLTKTARVVITFTLRDPLFAAGGDNVFYAEWLGNFRIPVHQTTYRFFFPPGFAPSRLEISPSEGHRFGDGNRSGIEVIQKGLSHRQLRVRFAPRLVEGARTKTGKPGRTPWGCFAVIGATIAAFGLCAVGCVVRAVTGKPFEGFWSVCESSGSGSGSGYSSCSSCGSGCSSCGGGCGGCGGCGG